MFGNLVLCVNLLLFLALLVVFYRPLTASASSVALLPRARSDFGAALRYGHRHVVVRVHSVRTLHWYVAGAVWQSVVCFSLLLADAFSAGHSRFCTQHSKYIFEIFMS